MRIITALLLSSCCYGQMFPFPGPSNSGAGAVAGGITLVTHTTAKAPAGTKGTSSPAIDTSTATLLVCTVGDGNTAGGITETCSDSKTNTWHCLTQQLASSSSLNVICYAWDHGGSPLAVGSGHTFSVQASTASGYPSAEFMAFAGTRTASDPFDQQNGANSGVAAPSTLSTGSVTPTTNNQLIVTGFGYGSNTSTVSVSPGGFAISDQVPDDSVNSYSSAGAWLVETTATAQNPQWTLGSGASQLTATVATFKQAP